ncbi:MAG: LptF/LptG family permease, partial [Fusobacteriaceae bacterium]
MKIIERYILDELKMPVLMGVSIFTFIFLIDIIVAMMENIIVRGISLVDTLRLLSFYLPPILSQTIPMGIFLGVMVTFSKFTRNSESIAIASMGMGIKKTLRPILLISVAATLFIFFLQESIIPKSFEKLQYLTLKIATENPVFQMEERVLMDDVDQFSIYIDKIERHEGIAKGVLCFL